VLQVLVLQVLAVQVLVLQVLALQVLALQAPGERRESALVVDDVQVLHVESDVAGTPARQGVGI